MIAITGATGQLGQLVIKHLLEKMDPSALIAVVRNPSKAQNLEAKGLQIRCADYNSPKTLDTAFADVERVLLISSSEIGHRAEQHRNAIDAAKRQKVKLLVYTSVLRADTSVLSLAEEHRQTESYLRASGIPSIILRNGWYTENYTASIPAALANKAFIGSADQGKISSAPRSDYAAAAAAVMAGNFKSGQVLELAGDESYTLAQLAAEISKQTGQAIPYVNLPEAGYRDTLLKTGLPVFLADGLASWDTSASQGALFDTSHQLAKLIGRRTTSLAESVKQALLPQ